MSKDKYKHAMEVIGAIEAGKQIQAWTEFTGGYWADDSEPFRWSLQSLNDPNQIRIKREPRRVFVNFNKDGIPENVYREKINAQGCQDPDWCSESAVEFVEVIKQ